MVTPEAPDGPTADGASARASDNRSWTTLGDFVRARERLSAAGLLELTVTMIPHAQHAAITLVRGSRKPVTLSASDEKPRAVDEIQYDLGEGPCLQATQGPDVVLSAEIAADSRWPSFGRVCTDRTGIRSMLSLQLPLTDKDRGALNLYSSHPHAFDAADVSIGTVLAAFMASVVDRDLHQHDVTHLKTALDSNRQISVAIGILMARRHLTHATAFRELVGASNRLNLKLREVAARVEYTGDLPAG